MGRSLRVDFDHISLFTCCMLYVSIHFCLSCNSCIRLVPCALTLPVSGLSRYVLFYTVKPVKRPLTNILMASGSLMKVESIAECSAILLTCIKR